MIKTQHSLMLLNENAHHTNRNVRFVMHQNAHVYLSACNCDASSKLPTPNVIRMFSHWK